MKSFYEIDQIINEAKARLGGMPGGEGEGGRRKAELVPHQYRHPQYLSRDEQQRYKMAREALSGWIKGKQGQALIGFLKQYADSPKILRSLFEMLEDNVKWGNY